MKDNMFDGEKASRFLLDEAGQWPTKFEKAGCEFRWQALKMVFSCDKPSSVTDALVKAEKIIEWVNQPLKFK